MTILAEADAASASRPAVDAFARHSTIFGMTEVTRILDQIQHGDAHAAEQHPVHARLIELRYFTGLTGDETARLLEISPSTADRHWVFARAWLRRELRGNENAESF